MKQKLVIEDGCEEAVNPIPDGDGMFMFTLTPEMKDNPLQVFMDKGANSFLMKEGVEKRVVSEKCMWLEVFK